MSYNEWKDELKGYLLSVSEEERQRVLDYYAEAYADRRDAGYSEREIILQFGAPYDAAQRVLGREQAQTEERVDAPPSTPNAPSAPFIAACVLLAPLVLALVAASVGVTAGLFVCPIALFGEAIAVLIQAVSFVVRGNAALALTGFGAGFVLLALGLLLAPLFLYLIRLLWAGIRRLFAWVKIRLQERRIR